ncbi:MAG: flavodoxin family protein [Dehalococcoidales bacterium]|nr:flavodoxin family protein [Dehalococcoidales bacterium]
MKNLIIYVSIHHGNTEKVAKAMAEILSAELVKPHDVDITALPKYDLIGFGSGIYFGKYHKSLLSLVDKLPVLKSKKAFIFYTSDRTEPNRELKEKLLAKGFDIIGEFSCRGWDTWGPLKLIGGISKGRPNKEDLEKARNFAKDLLED